MMDVGCYSLSDMVRRRWRGSSMHGLSDSLSTPTLSPHCRERLSQYFFVPNQLNRYTLGARNSLKHNTDGSVNKAL
jgi:hypothetical protein